MASSAADGAEQLPFEKTSRSYVWKYFKRKKKQAICLLCSREFKYNGGTTSNLISHLERKHLSSVTKPESSSKQGEGSQAQQSMRSFAQAQPCSSKPCSFNTQREITRILSRWPWLDMRPIAIVRDQGLKELLAFVEPNYQLPSTTHVSALIRKQFDDGRAALSEQLLQAKSIALTTDIWTSKATQAFATTTAHFVNNDWELVSCVLETIHFPGSHTGIRISEQIKNSLTSYSIPPEKISAVVHDEAANVVLAGKILWDSHEWETVVCAAHRLQNAVKSAVDKRSMQSLLAKCRRLVGHFKHSALATNGLEEKQKTLGFKTPLRLIQEVSTRWNSTFHMLQRLVLLKQPIRLYLEDSMSERERASYDLSDVQWTMMKCVLHLLEAVDGVTTTLSGEKYSTLSWCLPLLFGLRDVAKFDEHDCMILVSIKKELTRQLNVRYQLDNLRMDSAPILAAALDPRFRKLSFLTGNERSQLHDILVQKASHRLESESSLDAPPAKKKNVSVLDRLLGEDIDTSSSVAEEVIRYFQQPPIKRKDDPFVWWHSNESYFPHLADLARHYLAIPSTSTPSERVFSVAGITVDKRRCALTAEMINALVFLHKNSSLLSLTNETPLRSQPPLILKTEIPVDSDDNDSDDDDDVVICNDDDCSNE